MAQLQAVHPSLRANLSIRTPQHMKRARGADMEVTEAATKIALDIFTDCTNVGVPFQEALLAIYLSGLQHGSALK